MILSFAVAVVLSQSAVKKVEVIRGGTTKKAPKTSETSLSAPVKEPAAEPPARELPVEAAADAKLQSDAKARAAQEKAADKHARDLQAEYEKAANALAGQE